MVTTSTPPPDSPRCPQAAQRVERTGPSRKAIVGWAVGMLAVLGLAWFIAAVVRPLWQVHQVVRRRGVAYDSDEVSGLGGPRATLPKVVVYLRLTRSWSTERWRAASLLKHCGTEAVPVALGLLEDRAEEVKVRLMAAQALGKTGDSQAVGSLIAALEDDMPIVRCNAAAALGQIGDEQAVYPLIGALEDYHPGASGDASWALVHVGKPAVKPLLGALNDERNSARTRETIRWILGRIARRNPGQLEERIRKAIETAQEKRQ